MQEHGRTCTHQLETSRSKVLCQALFTFFKHFGNLQGVDANPPARSVSGALVKPGWAGTNGLARRVTAGLPRWTRVVPGVIHSLST